MVNYLGCIIPLTVSQHQADAIYFDLRNAFDLVPHSVLLHKLRAFGLSCGYVHWFCSYLYNRKSQVRVSDLFHCLFK
jgi:hypothetical protein